MLWNTRDYDFERDRSQLATILVAEVEAIMKWFLSIVFLILTLPLLAFADSDAIFTSSGGVLTGTSDGFILTGATLTGVSGGGFGSVTGTDLGSVTFTTGILGAVSSVVTGGPIVAGGSFLITSNGSDGVPGGTLFAGTFSQGGTWVRTTDAGGNNSYTLTAAVSATDGSNASGLFSLTIDTGQLAYYGYSFSGYDVGSFTPQSTTTIQGAPVSLPEPGEVSLMGTGLLGLVGALGHKFRRRS